MQGRSASKTSGEPNDDNTSDSDMDVVYLGTNNDNRDTMCFDPIRGMYAEAHCVGLAVEHNERREKCYGPAFTPVPLGAPCMRVPVKSDGNCLFRVVSFALCGDEAYHLHVMQRCIWELVSQGKNKRYNQETGMLPQGFVSMESYLMGRRVTESGT